MVYEVLLCESTSVLMGERQMLAAIVKKRESSKVPLWIKLHASSNGLRKVLLSSLLRLGFIAIVHQHVV